MKKTEMIAKLISLKKKGLVPSAFKNIKIWLESDECSNFWVEIESLINKEKIEDLNNAFFQVIPFGTGGRRGMMGVGSNRINIRTISESAQGFVQYLKKCFGIKSCKQGIVVTYDIRHNSRLFAETAASVFAGNGFKVYFYDGVRSTPQISFTIRKMKAIGGAMISASHNPPSDNGIKVYFDNGGQIVSPHDKNIIKEVMAVKEIKTINFKEAKKIGKIKILGKKLDNDFVNTVSKLSLGNYRDAHILFTPLNGCASTSFLPVLKNVGFKKVETVKSQMPFDPDFKGVAKQIPNPEVPISLEIATKQAKKDKVDVLVAADPDADRIGVVSPKNIKKQEYVFLNGNQIGVLLLDYITKMQSKKIDLKKTMVIKTAVTTDLLTKIAVDNGCKVITDLPVGFKYIGNAIDTRLSGNKFLFGAEESHGYLYGDYARDKDGAIAALLICEYAALLKIENKTLFEQLEIIKKKYGYYRELLQAVFYKGMDGMDKMKKIMDKMREKLPTKVAGKEVFTVLDQLNKKFIDPKTNKVVGKYIGFPDNALIFYLNKEKTIRVVVRPSGTEPKIKFYAASGMEVGEEKSEKEYDEIRSKCDKLVHEILEDFVLRAENISEGGERFEILG
ncbi:MAG: phospho-sugar mutase [Patescibacteria group bacterium]|nr:phospho-sugar mutase [Patescibacteria group bacterium]